jgi:Flp pilus assembly protein TadG
MRLRHKPRSRPAGAMIQFAVVGSITFLLLIGLLIGGLGIFRYQQVARLARDASRWASVHGTQYAADTKNTAATATDVYNNIISPNAAGLDLTKMTYSVTWSTSNSPYHTATVNGSTVNVANTVTVTISYQWVPEAYLGGVTLSSTSVTVMSY